MGTKILVAVLAAGMVASPAAMAEVSVSGQVSSVIGFSGDFDESFNIAQNNASGSRFRFKAEKEWGAIKVGLRHEIQNRKGPEGNNGEGSEGSNVASGQDDLRYSDIYFAGGLGKLSVGQGDGAANGIAESHTTITGNFFGGIDAFWFATNSIQTGVNLGFDSLDAFGRVQRVRYDSPKFNGLQLSASARSQDGEELALRYLAKAAGWSWTANAGFNTSDDNGDRQLLNVGVLAPFGLNLSARVGSGEGETDTNLVSVGYRVGKIRANIEKGTSTTADGVETDGTSFGVSYVGPITMYASFGKFERGAEEFSAPVVGFRLKF